MLILMIGPGPGLLADPLVGADAGADDPPVALIHVYMYIYIYIYMMFIYVYIYIYICYV